jgi:Ser/Thr protein kinase RdoA (MazF antagonist)
MEILPDDIRRHLPPECTAWNDAIQIVEVSSGLSGASVYRIDRKTDPKKSWCVRAWPFNVGRDRIEDIHQLIRVLVAAKIDFVPAPIPWSDHSYILTSKGRCWDLARWLPGTAVLSTGSPPDLWKQVGASLGRVHSVWRQYAVTQGASLKSLASLASDLDGIHSPTCLHRIHFAEDCLREGLDQIQHRVRMSGSNLNGLAECAVTWARARLPAMLDSLRRALGRKVRLQIVLRDVRPEHILFSQGTLTGIVDYDAIRWDSVTCDLARVMEPLAGPGCDSWSDLLCGYENHTPLDPGEVELLCAIHTVNPMLALLQWLQWHMVEQRAFARGPSAEARMRQLALLCAVKNP